MKLRRQLAAFFAFLGEALGEEPSPTHPPAELLQQFADLLSLLLIGVHVRVADVRAGAIKAMPKSRVQNASQVEPGLYVANRTTSIFQLSKDRYS